MGKLFGRKDVKSPVFTSDGKLIIGQGVAIEKTASGDYVVSAHQVDGKTWSVGACTKRGAFKAAERAKRNIDTYGDPRDVYVI